MEFNWEIDEDQTELNDPSDPNQGQNNRRRRLILLIGLTLTVALVGGGLYGWIRLEDQRTKNRIQTTIDLQVEAAMTGDGDRFFAGFSDTLGFRSWLMHPIFFQYWEGNPTIIDLDFQTNEIWALTEWELPGEPNRQRYLFFDNTQGTPQLISTSLTYWGSSERFEQPWGSLDLYRPDLPLEEELSRKIGQMLEERCGEECPTLSIELRPTPTLGENQSSLQIPSPHVYGLTPVGQPVAAYWEMVENRIADIFRQETIRVAIPERLAQPFEPIELGYEIAFPNRQVDLVTYDPEEIDFNQMMPQVDAIFFDPTLETVISGHLLDLTPFTARPTEFDRLDLYAQLWAAPWWEDRLWYIPIDAEISLVYADPKFFRDAGVDFPAVSSLEGGWDWTVLEETMVELTQSGGLKWGMVGRDPDLLLSAAYNSANRCEEVVTVRCNLTLTPADLEVAFDLYAQHNGIISISTEGNISERNSSYLSEASISSGKTALWISYPEKYETYLDSRNVTILPFPRSDHSASISPLRLRGAAISAHSEYPHTAWEFINYLSYQQIGPRRIPLRPSVANASRFWQNIPEPLGTFMRDTFPASRPVRLGENEYFSDELLRAIEDGSRTPTEAANSRRKLNWFDQKSNPTGIAR